MAGYDTLPFQVKVPIERFEINIDDSTLDHIDLLIKNAKPAIKTYFNTTTEDNYGIAFDWLEDAKKLWREKYNWREREQRINSYPQFIAKLKHGHVHFLGLFSKNPKAVPLMFIHGWPGSFLEYLGVCDILRTKYTPETLPYHVIVPSLPGYLFSDLPSPLERRTLLFDSADIMQDLMIALGFGASGYVVSGGDVGSFTARIMATKFSEAKALHLNFCNVPRPEGDTTELDEYERISQARSRDFYQTGSAYALAHGTKPATISAALEFHPFSLLAWMGEKYRLWAGITLPVEELIDNILLYWVTDSISRNLWSYVEAFGLTTTGRGPTGIDLHYSPEWYCRKPFAYSFFPYEIGSPPKKWVATTGDLVLYGKHEEGGHFGAWENPKAIAHDIEEFIKIAWSA